MPVRRKKGNKRRPPNGGTPFVSILTPTRNRRPFMMKLIEYVDKQDYPKERIEWCIYDDGEDKIRDLVANIPYVRYFTAEQRSPEGTKHIPIGSKRNYLHRKARGTYFVNMDDDDFYPPTRVSKAVEMLQKGEHKVVASSAMPMLFTKRRELYICGPYNKGNHGTGATLAYTREYARTHAYQAGSQVAEEKAFLEGWNVPIGQLDPFETILVIAHEENTIDKEWLLQGENANFMHKQPSLDRISESTRRFYCDELQVWLEKHTSRHRPFLILTDKDGEKRHLSPEQAAELLREKERTIAVLRERLILVTEKYAVLAQNEPSPTKIDSEGTD